MTFALLVTHFYQNVLIKVLSRIKSMLNGVCNETSVIRLRIFFGICGKVYTATFTECEKQINNTSTICCLQAKISEATKVIIK